MGRHNPAPHEETLWSHVSIWPDGSRHICMITLSRDEARANALAKPRPDGYRRVLVRRTVTYGPWEEVTKDA